MPMNYLKESRHSAISLQGKRLARAFWAGAAAACAVFAGVAPASAQRYQGGDLVLSTERDTMSGRFSDVARPTVIRMGSFLLRSFLSQEIGYDDNVFSTRDKRSDFTYTTAGGTLLQSDWKRHQVYTTANAAYVGFARFTEENTWVGDVAGGGFVDVTSDVKVGVDVSAARLIDERGDPDSINRAAEVTTYQRYRAEPWLTARTGRFTHVVAVQGETVNYPNATANNGQTINTAAKEYEQVRAGYRLGYRFLDPHEIFVRVENWDRNSTNDAGIPNENFTVQSGQAGITARVTPVIAVLAAAGLSHVENDNPVIPSADVFTYELRALWQPMRTLQLEARAQRDFASSIVTAFAQGSPGYVRSVYGLRATTEIRQGFIGFVDGFYLTRDYIETDREDKVWGFDVGLRYALGNGLVAAASWLWRNEESNGQLTYNRNLILARLSKSF